MRVVTVALVACLAGGACRAAPPPAPRSGTEASVPAPATVAPAATPAATPTTVAAQIDGMLRAEWSRESVMPAPPADDARFLRRLYLHVVGTIPPPERILSFERDAAPDKRSRAVDALLASPAYAERWATYWEDVLLGQATDPQVDRQAFHAWLVEQFAANTSWNRLVTELLTAEGRNGGEGGQVAMKDTSTAPRSDEGDSGTRDVPVHPAVNWFVKFREAPQDLAGDASRLFLGVQIQCAQCHDHKTEKWKQEDFQSLASCFMRTRTDVVDKAAMGDVKRVDVYDLGRPLPRHVKNPALALFATAAPRALDGTDFSRAADTRQSLAAWMTSPTSPWFPEAIVNRMWAHFFGRGFVDPIDDFRPSNPAVAPEVLKSLSEDFVAQGYDLRHLIRVMTQTAAYQLSSAAASNAGAGSPTSPDKLWSRFRLEPLGPVELLNALMDATGLEDTLRTTPVDVQRIRRGLFVAYSHLFDVDEEFEQTDFEGTVSQALALLNGRLVGGGTSTLPGSALETIALGPASDADKIRALYLRTLSRRPTEQEVEYFERYVNEPHADPGDVAPRGVANASPSAANKSVQGALGRKNTRKGGGAGEPEVLRRLEERGAKSRDPKYRAYADVFWELLNSSEFAFNH